MWLFLFVLRLGAVYWALAVFSFLATASFEPPPPFPTEAGSKGWTPFGYKHYLCLHGYVWIFPESITVESSFQYFNVSMYWKCQALLIAGVPKVEGGRFGAIPCILPMILYTGGHLGSLHFIRYCGSEKTLATYFRG